MNLFQLGNWTLSSGKRSFFKLECDALTDDDWKCLAKMISVMIGPFREVEGIPRGGLKLAAALEPYKTKDNNDPFLVVDDVATTGGSFRRAWDAQYIADGSPKWIRPGKYILGAVVFARGEVPHWVRPLFQLPQELWLPVETTSE